MSGQPIGGITRLLHDWRGGRGEALDALVERVYAELTRQARGALRGERRDHTLQTRGLVHETYLRLARLRDIDWRGRQHFHAVAAGVMRRVLVDHARGARARKRGGDAVRVTADALPDAAPDVVDVLALDEALTRLADRDESQARIVQLRYFGGLSVTEVADALSMSPASVKRKWSVARAWLYREMHDGGDTAASSTR